MTIATTTKPATGAEPDRVEHSLLVSKRGLARLLDISERSVTRKNSAGWIPRAIDLAGSKRWRRAEIYEWIQAGCPRRQEWEARSKSRP